MSVIGNVVTTGESRRATLNLTFIYLLEKAGAEVEKKKNQDSFSVKFFTTSYTNCCSPVGWGKHEFR